MSYKIASVAELPRNDEGCGAEQCSYDEGV
jgi:hypothetical protein